MPVEEAAKEVSKAVSNDIAVFRTKFDVETGKGRKRVLTPVEAELHLNPVSILFAAAAGLAGALAATVAWQGVSIPSPLGGQITLLEGMKDTGFGKDVNAAYERFMKARAQKRSDREAAASIARFQAGDFPDQQTDPDVFSADPCVRSKAAFDMETVAAFRAAIKEDAKRAGCAWAQ